jgi:hypothetical protein
MGLFNKSIDRQLADTKASREALQSRLITAQQLVNDQKAAAQKAARDGDDAALDKAEAKIRAGLIRVDTLIAALAEVDQNILQLDQQIREAADKAQRDEAAKVIEQCAADLGTAGATLDSALASMSELAGKIVSWCPDARGIHVFTASAREELIAATSMLQTILNSGSFPPALVLAKPAPPPAPMPQPEPTVQLCALKPITWLAADNSIQIGGRGEDIALPPPLAKHAVKLGAVCEMRDPRRRMVKESLGLKVGKPLYRNCVQLSDDMPLDDGGPEPFADRRVAAPIRSTPAPLPPGFEPLPTIGQPRQVLVQGARNDDLNSLAVRNNNNSNNSKGDKP